jgi:hypothetical protein
VPIKLSVIGFGVEVDGVGAGVGAGDELAAATDR